MQMDWRLMPTILSASRRDDGIVSDGGSFEVTLIGYRLLVLAAGWRFLPWSPVGLVP
jgi:hypothetical protein